MFTSNMNFYHTSAFSDISLTKLVQRLLMLTELSELEINALYIIGFLDFNHEHFNKPVLHCTH